MKVNERTYGYRNYPRKCPMCNEKENWLNWEWDNEDNKIHTCHCGAKLKMIQKNENYLYYGKPTIIRENWKWEIIE